MSNWSSRLRGVGARGFMSALRLPRPSRPSLPPATTSINGGGGHHPSWIQANSSKTQENAGTASWQLAQLAQLATANWPAYTLC
jgi:hypothetical protein